MDHVYLPKDGDAVYEDEVQALVASLYEGYNSTVFAYGARAVALEQHAQLLVATLQLAMAPGGRP